MNSITRISKILTKREKINSFILLFLMLTMAVLDSLGTASIMPFMAIISNPSLINTNTYLNYFYKLLNFTNSKNFIYFLGISTFSIMLFSMFFKSFTTYLQLRFTLMREYAIGERLVRSYLNQPYEWFLNKNSSVLGKNILSEIEKVINGSILPLLQIISNTFIAFFILLLLVYVNYKLALVIGIVFFLIYFLIYVFFKNYLTRIGKDNVIANGLRFKIINEAFSGIKDVKVLNVENIFLEQYKIPAINYAKNQSFSQVIGQLPRYLIETIAFGGIILLILFLMYSGGQNINTIIPVISLYVFAGYKMMPALQQIYNNIIYFKYAQPALENLYNEIKYFDNTIILDLQEDKLVFNNSIKLENIIYSYPNTIKPAINKITLNIKAKSINGIVGYTGSGKTTLIDILLGLLEPQKGNFFIDNIPINKKNINKWRRSVGYVPQNIYLIDDTIESNIAFGIPKNKINKNALINACKVADIYDFITNELPNSFETQVGERGIMLSGGQRQRIGIARAIYHSPTILILDEATSALDNITEKNVMNAIKEISNEVTIIIIAHRLTTIQNCDQIFYLEKGELKSSGNYKQLLESNVEFNKMALLNNYE